MDRGVGTLQQAFGVVNPQVEDIVVHALPGIFLENPEKMVFAQISAADDAVNGDFLTVMALDILGHALQLLTVFLFEGGGLKKGMGAYQTGEKLGNLIGENRLVGSKGGLHVGENGLKNPQNGLLVRVGAQGDGGILSQHIHVDGNAPS